MAELRNGGPYIWITWLSKLLVGKDSCEWAGWFKAQHEASSWQKLPQAGFDQVGWMLAHTGAVNTCRADLEAQGYQVWQEGQNSFRLRGRTATLGGKLDLVARRYGPGLVVDLKTGAPSPAHLVQVMVYQYAVPLALDQHRGGPVRWSGTVPGGPPGGDSGPGG